MQYHTRWHFSALQYLLKDYKVFIVYEKSSDMAEVVRDIMTKDIVTIEDGQTALEAARIMSQKGISSLIVVKDGAPKGIITERDFVKKICAKQLQPSEIKIGAIMSRIRTVADPDTPIEIAVQRMANQGIRRLPIMQEAKVVGIITVTDLARYLRTMLLLEGALDSNKAAGFWSDNDTNDSDDHDGDNPSHNDKTSASTTTTSITSSSTSISHGKANTPYNSIS
jgi:CBS domain-containing protein